MPVSRALLAPLLVAVAFSACTCAPSKAGDPCDPLLEVDPCPSGLLCQVTPEGGTCFVSLGGSCDKEASDALCADGAACAGEQPVCGGRGAECNAAKNNCADGSVCEPRGDDDRICAAPLIVRGRVVDAESNDPLEGADVIAIDAEDDVGVALSRIARTDADGRFEMPVSAARTEGGEPAAGALVLRAAARDHQASSVGLRPGTVLSLADAEETDDAFVIDTPETRVALESLPAAQRGRAAVSGTVAAGGARAGALVVAEGNEVPAPTGLADKNGVFRIFNVENGAVTVRGYAAGLTLTAADINVAGDDVTAVVLPQVDGATAEVTGALQIGPGGTTSLALVPESTFVASVGRGEVPRGLSLGEISNAFTLTDVPPGRWVLLASMANDGLVRDPGLTMQDVHFEVVADGAAVDLADPILVVSALAIISPGANGPELVDENPTFVFGADAAADSYRLDVLDSFGGVVWTVNVPSGAVGEVSVPYAGAALDAGAQYQFRALALLAGATIGITEELSGAFVVVQ